MRQASNGGGAVVVRMTSGDLLESKADALVNAVNSVGVMGKGIALQFKRAFPENFRAYEAACKRGQVRPGEMFVHATDGGDGPRYIVNFPTKNHWRSKSRLADIEAGLEDLRRVVRELGLRSVAVPPLGCGNGGLDWDVVGPVVERELGGLAGVEVLVYVP
ncbi:macro domain-containing protein [Amycolatopsis rhizosphaerae]|uniref:Macro domain-containing protein n=2 Tax=Amycolatopsis rhizosphaerae TaxID=2053003 RepID=A0A558B2X5_9PSEU|nr:macro domain-containing protein [Amycolatopsis rhizosphaerae]